MKLPNNRHVEKEKKKEVKEEDVENWGLRELIDGGAVAPGRILHRNNINIGSSRFVSYNSF